MKERSNYDYYTQDSVDGYQELVEYITGELKGDYWVYRAQHENGELETTFERACQNSHLTLDSDAPGTEGNMIREFARVYDGDDRENVQNDKLYCLSLMRHYGAPSRLLDFTYSMYVAVYFALECAYDNVPKKASGELDYENPIRSCAIWCIDTKELVARINDKYKDKYPELIANITARSDDSRRENKTFLPLYMENKYKFVGHENPLPLHRRLHLQQGTFLCPGNISVPFMENLLYPYRDYGKTDKIRKIICRFQVSDLQEAFKQSMRMNMTREGLFPGLDGFAQSMKYQLWFYRKLVDWRREIT